MEQNREVQQTPPKLTRQQRRHNAQLEAKRLAKRAGKKVKGVPRKERRQVAFDITTVQMAQGMRKGTEYKSLEEEFKNIATSKHP